MNRLLHPFFLLLTHQIYICNADIEDNSNETNLITFKTNLCERQMQVLRGETLLQDSLAGMNITGALVGDGEEEEIWKIIMDEIARQGRFNITYNLTGYLGDFESFDDKLLNESSTYDVAVDWYVRKPERLNMGILFPEAWWDADTIMVIDASKKKGGNIFGFFAPFTTKLWVAIGCIMIFTGVVYFILEYFRSKRQGDNELEVSFDRSLFLSANAFVGHSEFGAQASSTRVLVFSYNFLALVIISAYTANLASVLVYQNSAHVEIKDFNDVLIARKKICVQPQFPYVDEVIEDYPQSKNLMVGYESAEEMFQALHDGKCYVLLTSLEGWYNFERDDTYNKNCNMMWVGRRLEVVPASFAVRASTKLCSSLLNDVLNFYLIKMKKTKALEKIWDNYRDIHLNNTCSASDKATLSDDIDLQLGIEHMAGILIIHLCIIGLAIIGESVLFCGCVSKKDKILKDDVKEVINKSMMGSSFLSSKKSLGQERSIERSTDDSLQLGEKKNNPATNSEKILSVVGLPFILENLEDIVVNLKEVIDLKNRGMHAHNSDMIIVKND